MPIDDGGPAFPNTITSEVDGGRLFPNHFGEGGMSLLQHYAGKAMQEFLAAYLRLPGESGITRQITEAAFDTMASASFLMGRAMITEHKKLMTPPTGDTS